MPEPAPMLAAALALAAEGYPVFLLGRTKRPVANCPACPKADAEPSHDPEACRCLTCHGFYAATRDPQSWPSSKSTPATAARCCPT